MRVLLLLGLVAATALITAVPATAKPPRDFVGIVAEDVFAGNHSYREQAFATHRRLGVQVIRQTFDWSMIETHPGQYNFGFYDAYVARAAQHGIRIIPVLFRPPSFRARGAQTDKATHPPKRFSEMGYFGAAVARRYGPKGSLWQRLPRGSRKLPITSYQVWNEPNLPVYWPSGPNAKEYAQLLRATANGIRRTDRRARILSAGMPDSEMPGAIPLQRYIKGLYKAGAKPSFDTLSINTYASDAGQLIKLLKSVRKTMNQHGDRKAQIWASEFGWATQGPKSRFTVGHDVQARNIAGAIAAMGKQRRKLRLSGFVYWNWKDTPPYRAGFDFWGLHAGLLQLDGKPKPSFTAFAQAVSKL